MAEEAADVSGPPPLPDFLGGEGPEAEEEPAAEPLAPGQNLWSHVRLVGQQDVVWQGPDKDAKAAYEETFEECDRLAAFRPRARLGRAPYKQRVARKKAQISVPGQDESQAKQELPQADRSWQISEDLAAIGSSRPAEPLPGVASSAQPKKSEPLPKWMEEEPQLVKKRVLPDAPDTGPELRALMGRERAEEKSSASAEPASQLEPGGEDQDGPAEEMPPPQPPPQPSAEEAELQRRERLLELLECEDILEQGTFKIVGSWDDFQMNDMLVVGSDCVHFVPVPSGQVRFQILHRGDWARTLYPSVADANPHEPHVVMGPDDKGHGRNWTIGAHPADRCPPGTYFKVILALNDGEDIFSVRWEEVGPEAAARRARNAAMQEAGLAGEPEEQESVVRVPPALKLLDRVWDRVPVNLGQAYDVDASFTIAVALRAPMHKDQGGRILAKRQGRSGWELVAPRNGTGEVSFYSSRGGHKNIGSTRVDDGEWHHIAVTFHSDGEMRSYIDGRFSGSDLHKVGPQPEAELWLGTRTESSGLFIGDLLELRVFDAVLSEEEIEYLAKASQRTRELFGLDQPAE